MIRTRERVKVGMLERGKEVWTEEVMTCIDGLGIRQVEGNMYYTITVTKGEGAGKLIAYAPTFYDAADYARTLMQNYPNFHELVEEKKIPEIGNAMRRTQFMLTVHFGTVVDLVCGNFNSKLRRN